MVDLTESSDLIANKVAINECRIEDLDSSIKHLWMYLAQEMFELEPITLPSEANSNKWLDFVKEGLLKKRSILLTAKVKEKIVGLASITLPREMIFEVQETFGVINDLYVLPGFRKKGIGKNLLEECSSRIKAEGFKRARISVLSADKNAIQLYKKAGFKVFIYNMTKKL
jgi:ribosomal protein S18 acetylase RimI-like enzyme